MKKSLNYCFVFIYFILITSCESQSKPDIMDVVNDKDYYYSELYTVHETKLKVRGVNLLKAILKRAEESKIDNLSEICGSKLNEFREIEGALDYFKLECKANEHYEKVVSKFGIDYLQKHSKEISIEFFKIHPVSELRKEALPLNNN